MASDEREKLVELLESCPVGPESYGIRMKRWSSKWNRFGIMEVAVENPREAAKDPVALTDILQQMHEAFEHFDAIGPPPEAPGSGDIYSQGHLWGRNE